MRKLTTLVLLLVAAIRAGAQDKPAAPTRPAYDAALAQRLGADERGMKRYVFVILKTGLKADLPKAERDALFTGHMTNLNRLADEGKLIVAGPLFKNDRQYEGIFVFNVGTVKEAEALLATDPAVAGGALAFEAYAWYSSAALTEVASLHKRIDKTDR